MAAALVLHGSACGEALEVENTDCSSCTDEVNLATLDCDAPFPVTAEMGEPPPAALDPDAIRSMGGVDLEAMVAHGLLAIDPTYDPYKVSVPEHCVPPGDVYTSIVRICVDAAGEVSGLTVVETSLPIIDSQLPYVISRWVYEPYIQGARPTPFCYPLRYTVR